MKPVLYLCYSDTPEKSGLVFPNELKEDSYTLGIWVIAVPKNQGISDTFEFDAVNNNKIVSLKLIRLNRLVYYVNTDMHGKFFFRVNNIFYRYEKYVGASKIIRKEDKLFQLTSMDIQKLERACDNGFFFVGRIDNDKIYQIDYKRNE